MMKSNILIVNGHPDAQSFCSALAAAYREGAESSRANVREIALGEIRFEPILKFGYRKRMELEESLLKAQEDIAWADHLVFVYPTWWGSMPALLKGFFDRVFLPGFAFKYRDNSSLWDKLLKGKTARLIVTTDTPSWYNRLVYRNAGHGVIRKNILQFCGIAPVKVTDIGPVRPSSADRRAKWLEKVKRLGAARA